MRVKTLVALAEVSMAAGCATRDQIREYLEYERGVLLFQIDNLRYLQSIIDKQEFKDLGHHITLGKMENKVQMINHALGRV